MGICGVLYAMTFGEYPMHKLFADNLDLVQMVSNYIIISVAQQSENL